VRYYAVRSLAELRHLPAVPHLTTLAEVDAAPHVRIAAVDALGAIAAPASAETLKRLAHDDHEALAAAALVALGRIADGEGLTELQEAVRAESPARRTAAVQALAANASQAAASSLEWAAAVESDAAVATATIQALGTIAASNGAGARTAIDALITLLSDRARRADATAALTQLPPACIDGIAAALAHPDAQLRANTIEVLGRFQHAAATERIETALADPSPLVREAAVTALARVGARGLDARFAEIATQDQSKAVRRAATLALQRQRA
jgi:HEAT repeat protein